MNQRLPLPDTSSPHNNNNQPFFDENLTINNIPEIQEETKEQIDHFPEEINEPEEIPQGQDQPRNIYPVSQKRILQEIKLSLSDPDAPTLLDELYLRLAQNQDLRRLKSFSSYLKFKVFWENLCRNYPMIKAQWKALSGSQDHHNFDS